MIEFGVSGFKGLQDFVNDKIATGTKPCLLFSGPVFEHDPEMKRVKSLLIDFFRGPVVTHVRLAGLEHVLQVGATSVLPKNEIK
jgi:ribosome production factor 2